MKVSMKSLVVVAVALTMSAGAYAFTFMGAPTAELEQGQWKAGYTFSWAEMDLEGKEEDGSKYKLLDNEINRHFFDLGYGLAEGLELNVLLGTTSVELGDEKEPDGTTDDVVYESGNDFAWGFNTKWTFLNDETVDWGLLFQMTWFDVDDVEEGVTVGIDGYDMQIAVGPTIDMGGWDLYCGGYYYMFDADAAAMGWKDELEEEDSFGGYVGAAFEIFENTDLAIECAFSGDTLGIGGNVGWCF